MAIATLRTQLFWKRAQANPHDAFFFLGTHALLGSQRRDFVLANCACDSLGIAAALGRDTDAPAVCAAYGAPGELGIRDGEVCGEGVVHLLVPARHFWDDIVFT